MVCRQLSEYSWEINPADGLTHTTIFFYRGASVHSRDFAFV
jgi:hypothetical protein